jgi:NAD(P)H-hydrate epimerase
MAAIDRRTIDAHGIPGITLMHRAGKAVVDELLARTGSVAGDRIIILCGHGNNGGDGFVIARLLRDNNADVALFLVSEQTRVAGDARIAMDEWIAAGGEIVSLTDDDSVREAAATWVDADYVVDTLLGTGLTGEVHGVIRTAIEEINRLGVPVIAVDIPSGISGDTGQVCGVAVKAMLTVTFGLPKVGHAFYPGRRHCGTLSVADIGFPEQAVAEALENEPLISMSSKADAVAWLPKREPNAHKGSVGKVFVLAGSVGMTGAAALASEAALRSGAGLVYLGCPERLNDILETKLTEVVTLPLPEMRKRRCLSLRALGDIRRQAAQMQVLAIGPGIGRYRETVELVRRVVAESPAPLVLDADALFALAGANLFPLTQPVVLTPHYGEFARLLGVGIADVERDPVESCRRAATEWGVTLLLKGAPSVVCGPSGETWVNPTGNAGMATAGAGDVLTGLIAGLIAQGLQPEIAARLGAYAHGMAGDFARDELGTHGMIAGDILRHLPKAMRELEKG